MPDFSTQPCSKTQTNIAHIEANSPYTYLRKATNSYFIIAVLIAVMSPTCIIGQTRRGQATTRDFVKRENVDDNIVQNVRSLTARATITVQGRDQGRYLTVFATPVHGYVEFGFPTPRRRPLGSLELVDVTSLATRHYPPGVRKVQISHGCSNLYLTVDKYGQARACKASGGKSAPLALNRNTHCIDGRKLHVCTNTPYIYLDSLSNIYLTNSTQSPNTPNLYKIRFEKPSPKARYKKILYAVVTRATWELKLRSQNGIIKRAVVEACLQLWPKSLHLLFQRVVEQRKLHQSDRNSNLAKVCDIDPALIVEEIIQSVNANDFTLAIHQAWRHHAVLNLLGMSMPWSHMSERYKSVISVVALRTVRKLLMDALLHAANMECLRESRWGKMAQRDKIILLERTLTLAWLNQRVASSQAILHIVEKYLDVRTTTFVINENG